jgi:hypothetical protein
MGMLGGVRRTNTSSTGGTSKGSAAATAGANAAATSMMAPGAQPQNTQEQTSQMIFAYIWQNFKQMMDEQMQKLQDAMKKKDS